MILHWITAGALFLAGAGRLFDGWAPRTRQAAESLTGLSMNREDVLFCFFPKPKIRAFSNFIFFGGGEKGG